MPQLAIRIRFWLACCCVLVVAHAAGCGEASPDKPSGGEARTALETALSAWQKGEKPNDLNKAGTSIQVHDTPWTKGDVLSSFEIVREEGGTAEHEFSVKLKLTKPAEEQDVTYHVLGRNPVMIFRHNDYLRNINMENGPSLISPAKSGRNRSR